MLIEKHDLFITQKVLNNAMAKGSLVFLFQIKKIFTLAGIK
jgi:hypothetical protein